LGFTYFTFGDRESLSNDTALLGRKFASVSRKKKVSRHKSRALIAVHKGMVFDYPAGVTGRELKNRRLSGDSYFFALSAMLVSALGMDFTLRRIATP